MNAKEYKKLYSLGIKDRNNSMQDYNFFLKNLGVKKLEELVEEREKPRVLDIGCGEGNALKELKKLYREKVYTTGIDLVKPESIEGIDSFIEGNALEEEFGEQDIVVSFRALHEIGSLEEISEKTAECLKERGIAVLSARIQNENGFLGEMKQKDLEFTEKLSETKKWKNCKVKVFGKILSVQGKNVLEGATIVLEK